MQNTSHLFHYQIQTVQFTELGPNWNTELFVPQRRLLPYGRLYFPVSGEGSVTFLEKTYTLERGKMLLIPPFASVKLKCSDHLEKYWAHFNIWNSGKEWDLFMFCGKCLEWQVPEEKFAFVTELFEKMIPFFSQEAFSNKLTLLDEEVNNSAITLLLAPFLKSILSDTRSLPMNRLLKLLDYLNSHIEEAPSLETLGKVAGVVPDYLSSLFRKQLGASPVEFRNSLRLDKIRLDLNHRTHNLSEIAEKWGFSSEQAFSKWFKRQTGISPRAFRQKEDY